MKLPVSLPDELLLSRLIRHVTVSGERPREFAHRAFGSHRVSLHPFLTAGIAHLARKIGEHAETLLFRQTLAPLFMFFLPAHADEIKQSMMSGVNGEAHRASQLSSFGAGDSLSLKWCPLCCLENIQQYGVAYWHRIHQVPGLTACAYHPIRLENIGLSKRLRIDVGLLPHPVDQFQYASGIENQVAKFASELLENLRSENFLTNVVCAYRMKLNELGFITVHDRVRRKRLMQDFVADMAQYGQGSNAPLPRHLADYRYLTQLLTPGASHHPFRHLSFSCWLFRDPQELFDFGQKKEISTAAMPVDYCKQDSVTEQQCLRLLRLHHSPGKVSRLTGKSSCYLKRLALLNDIPINHKPKKLTQELEKRIIHMAYAGFHRKSIAVQCDIGVGSVEQVISSHRGLVEHRKRGRWESKRRRSRVVIARYLGAHPRALRRDCKAECSAAYFWLYFNDVVWLESVLPAATKPKGRYA